MKTYRLIICVLWTLFCSIVLSAEAQEINIPEPVPPPAAVREAFDLGPFYQQWIDVGGMPVVASAEVNPYALKEAAWIVWRMIEHRRNVLLRAIVENKLRVVVIGHTEMVTQIPEHSNSRPNFYWDKRSRGFGSTPYEPTASCSEENLLNYPGDPYAGENVHIHEFAHALHWVWDTVTPGFDERLKAAYNAALRKGLWQGAYAGSNHYEYWAEGVQSWFNANWENVSAHNHVNTRAELKEYDSELAVLVAEVCGDRNWRYTEATVRKDQPHLRGFNPQDSPTFAWPPELLALHEEFERDPESTGDGQWVNLKRHEPSELPRLRKLKRGGAYTQIFIGNLMTEAVRVYFIEPDGTEDFRFDLPGNDMADPRGSEVGGLWLVKDKSGKNLAVYRAEAKTGRALIIREYKGPKVDIPDQNLAAAVRKHLGLAASTPITQEALEALVKFGTGDGEIRNLTGLEYATDLVELSLWNNQIKDITPLAKLVKLRRLHLQANQITDITPLAGLTQLEHLHLWGNQIRDISVLTELTQLKSLWLDGNQIHDVSSLVGLSKLERLTLRENPIQDRAPLRTLLKQNPDLDLDISITDLAVAGPKIEGPWLWIIVPALQRVGIDPEAPGEDWLATASGGSVTEAQIAANGATAGERVRDRVWTLGKLAPAAADNVGKLVNTIGLATGSVDYHVAYGSIVLESPRKQKTWMYAGSDDNHKVWLNGELVRERLDWHWNHDYQESFPVTLKEGKNVLLVAIQNGESRWSGYFGFESDAEYNTVPIIVGAVSTTPTWDVNGDGHVNILDLVLITQYLGGTAPATLQVDVNGDGNVNILDLVAVAQHLGEPRGAAAPSFLVREIGLDPAMLQAWITQAQAENDGSLVFREGIANLQRLLASLLPEKTALFPNYPNPFNPETWIPYQLAEPADVALTIYDIHGRVVRHLNLGYQRAGVYQNKARAAYWDGRNAQGEPVASGVYFYTLKAGDFSATRKMLIRK